MILPPFPVDDGTLALLEAAMNPREHGDPEATQSSVWPLLEMMSRLGGGETEAGEVAVHYTEHSVMEALIAEVRRLRAGVGRPEGETSCVMGPHVMRDLDHLVSTLKGHREWLAESQRDVARRMGQASAASVCQWETGTKRPRGDHLFAWLHALGYDLALVPRPVVDVHLPEEPR